MSFSISATLGIFGKEITVTPNPQFPTRIESQEGFKVTGDQMTKLTENFEDITGLPFNFGGSDDDQYWPEEVDVTNFVVDIVNKEFQIAIDVQPGGDFFLNKYPDLIEIIDVSLFISLKKSAETSS